MWEDWEIVPVLDGGVKNLSSVFFFSLSYAPSILHKNTPRHPRASPGPLNENQTWEKKEQMEDPSPTKPSQARPTSEILVFAVSTEILRLSAEH